MKYISFGKTGLRVSRLALGTAAFGLENYGICEADEGSAVSEEAAVRLIRSAVDRGINFFDTARGYGRSERVVGNALAGVSSCVVATKLSIPKNITKMTSPELRQTVMESIETSLVELQTDVLDIVQIHNATVEVLEGTGMLESLERARQQGKLRFIGASVYGVDNAFAAIRCGNVVVLQVALNLLDQRMLSCVLTEARNKNVGVLARSVFLKGVLTSRVKLLPPTMHSLAASSDQARQALGDTWDSLPGTAVRFCLSAPGVHSVLMGLRSVAELEAAISAEEAGALSHDTMCKAAEIKLMDEMMLDPSQWPLV
jgi:aryl-alcohol dehydrogenase-like predicted oxidoreductase